MFNVKALKSLKKDVENVISKAKIKGVENIKHELEKRNIDATVTCTQNKNKLLFKIEPKAQKIESGDLSPKEATKMQNLLGPIPIEMFNQEASQNAIPDAPVNKAIEKTQEDIVKDIHKLIKNAL